MLTERATFWRPERKVTFLKNSPAASPYVMPATGKAQAYAGARPAHLGVSIGILLAMLVIAFVVALGLALGLWQISVPLVAAFAIPLFYYVLATFTTGRFDTIFWIIMLTMFTSSAILQATRVDTRFMQEVVLYAAAPLVAFALAPHFKRSGVLQAVVVVFVLFCIVSAIATVSGRSRLVAAGYTFIFNFKPMVLLGIGAVLVWSDRTERTFWWMVRWIWLPLLAACLVQWFMPGVYDQLFSEAKSTRHPLLPEFPGARGVFHHPALLATLASVLSICSMVRYLQTRQLFYVFSFICYLVLVLMSGQRHELVASAVTLLLTAYFWRRPVSLTRLVLAGAAAICLAFALLYPLLAETIDREIRAWGLVGDGSLENIRSILYSDAFKIAVRYFPFGSGLGTFGSAGSVRFDQSLYNEMGYHSFWWFETTSVLMDSYWTRYIAETGWFGFFLMLMIYVLVLQRSLAWIRESPVGTQERAYAVLGFAGLFFLLLASPTSFGLAESMQGFLPLIFLGLTWQLRNRRLHLPNG